MTTVRTRIDRDLEEKEVSYGDDPERLELITRTRQFKSSWLELAAALSEVKRSGRWQEWGFDTFENYTKKELNLKADTVDKLTGSYAFLRKSAPSVLKRDGVSKPIPSFQAIDFLRRAAESPKQDEAQLFELKQKVFEEGAPVSQLNRSFKEVFFPSSREEKKDKERAGVRNVGKRLRELLEESNCVPERISSRLKATLDELLEHLAIEEEESRAA